MRQIEAFAAFPEVDHMIKNLRNSRVQSQPLTRTQLLVQPFLEKIQEEIGPDKDHLVVGINTDTGEYVLGGNYGEVYRAFRKRFPDAPSYVCCVDGSPAIRM